MQAIVYSEYGPPDGLRLEQVPKPAPKEDEVLVKVHAASVNSWDVDLLLGRPYLSRMGAFRKPKYPILGADIAGVIEAVGSNVERFEPGDEVFGDISGCHWGGYAEYVCARADVVAHKSASMSFEQAASLPQAGVLAMQGLRYGGEVKPGQEVLFNGAGGGVGVLGVQIAKACGAEVTAVDSTGKLETLRSLGADYVIDYEKEDFTRSGRTYDLIVDVVAKRSLSDYRHALRPEGAFAIIGGSSAALLSAFLKGTWISRTTPQKIGLVMHTPNTADLDLLTNMVETGKLAPVIDTVYPLSEVPEAFRRLAAGDVLGKIVIKMEGCS